jgi:methionyl-tRNA synthetase
MNWQSFLATSVPPGFAGAAGLVLFIVVLWSLVWKGMALWKAARQENKVWFVVLLLVNIVGILDILYLYVFSRKSAPPVEGPRM